MLRTPLRRVRRHLGAMGLVMTALLLGFGTMPNARAASPIRIGVMAPLAHIDGKGIVNAAKLAASQINARGGIQGRPVKLYVFDDHFSAADAARAFQRAVEDDHVVAMIGIFTSEVALAMEPWAGRLKTPLIVTGAVTPKLAEQVHAHYARLKYVFHGTVNARELSEAACLSTEATVVKPLHYTRAVIFSEDSKWTKPADAEYKKCIPKSGMKLLKTIIFSRKTSDFTPIYNEVENLHARILMSAVAIVGEKAVVQWRQQEVPALFAGNNGQAGATRFWDATNGATEGVMTVNTGANGVPMTPRTPAFYQAYVKRFGVDPAFTAYPTYDTMYMLKHAITRAGTTRADPLVKSIEKTNFVGVCGRIRFHGRADKLTHGLVFSANPRKGMALLALQWQHGKQVVLWPKRLAQGKFQVPPFVPKPGP